MTTRGLMFHIEFLWLVSKKFIISGSSLPAKQATKASSSTKKGEEEEAEPVGVITLAVPTLTPGPTATTGNSSSADSEASDYLVTTYNSVTGYETSV